MPSLSAADEAPLTRSRPAAPPVRPAGALGEDGLPTPRRHLAAAAVLAAIVLAVLDGAIANVALPTIAGALRVSPAASVWVVTGYRGHSVGCSPANAKAGRTVYARPRLSSSRGGLAPWEVERPASTGVEGGKSPQEVAGEAYLPPAQR